MARKPRSTTRQEALVASYLQHSISSWSIFHPDLWLSSSGAEPADMICVIGRAMLFVNMTKGKSYFEKLSAHNIDQARKRLADWRDGRRIKGKNGFRSFDIGWNDIDLIAVVSVVDGPHAACCDHSIVDLDMPTKVKMCVSLTGDIFRKIAERRGSARDIINFCREIRDRGRLTEFSTKQMLSKYYNLRVAYWTNGLPDNFSRFGQAMIGGRPVSAFEEARVTFEGIRKQQVNFAERFSDLGWDAIFAASAYIVNCRYEMEDLNEGRIRSVIIGEKTKFHVIVSSNMTMLNKNMPEALDISAKNKCAFSYIANITRGGVLGLALSGSADDGDWDLSRELANFRAG